MAVRKNNNLIKLIVIAVVLLLILVILVVYRKKNGNSNEIELDKAEIKYQEEINYEIKEELNDKTEQERMQYYCANFFRLIDNNNYEKAYELLYSEFKENYFPTFANFKVYFEDYFPSDFALSYSNIERLGDIYVLNVNVKDTLNGSYGKKFDMYVVIKENKLNDYCISFSRNSAVGEEE